MLPQHSHPRTAATAMVPRAEPEATSSASAPYRSAGPGGSGPPAGPAPASSANHRRCQPCSSFLPFFSSHPARPAAAGPSPPADDAILKALGCECCVVLCLG